MGNIHPKFGQEIDNNEPQTATGSVPSTPILTPKIRALQILDPRSPSTNVPRTPIELVLSPSQKYPALNNKILTNKLCDTFNLNSPTPNSFDPRSPAVEFNRTPIILPTEKPLPQALHNKNLDNVRKTLLPVTPKKLGDIQIQRKGPKLLGCSPLVTETVETKRKSFVGMLETNLDYVETNLDEVVQRISLKDTKAKSLEANKLPIKLEIIKKVDDINEPLSDEISSILDIDDDGFTKKPKDIVNSTEIVEEKPQIVDVLPKVKEFDAKLSHLIYSDKEIIKDVPKKGIQRRENNRTPLAERNGALSKLNAADKSNMKSDYAVSKIPVFKDKRIKNKSKVQCENTPPRILIGKEKSNRKAHWDSADSTLII